jgi:hypothetical protein
MKINLVIEADTPEELHEACRALGGGAYIDVATSASPRSENQFDPRDVYGPGNGPVDAVRTDRQSSDASETPSDTPDDDTAPEHDAVGLPWDERIHAGSKVLNADGTWRKRRGVDDKTVAAVEAELRGGEPKPDATPQPTEDAAPAPQPIETDANVTEGDVSIVTGVDMSTPAPRTYTAQDAMKLIGSAMSSGSREPTYIAELCQNAGVAQITDMFGNPDALAAIVAKLRTDGVITDV